MGAGAAGGGGGGDEHLGGEVVGLLERREVSDQLRDQRPRVDAQPIGARSQRAPEGG